MDPSYTLARYQVKDKRFEIIVNPDKALNYKLGVITDITGILVHEIIFSDSKKGKKASNEDIMKVFDTNNINEITKYIIEKGELLIKAEQRKELIAINKRKIVAYISKNCIDTRTKAPIPPIRVEQAFDEINLRIDPFMNLTEEMPNIIKTFRETLPLRQQTTLLEIKIPAIYAGKAIGYVKRIGDTIEEEWMTDGSYQVKTMIPSGTKNEVMNTLGNLTSGVAQMEIIEEKVI